MQIVDRPDLLRRNAIAKIETWNRAAFNAQAFPEPRPRTAGIISFEEIGLSIRLHRRMI